MDTLPTLLQELERKTVELLEAKLGDFERGDLTGSDLSLIGKTAWSIVSGLVSNDISEMCAQAADQGLSKPLKKYLAGEAGAICLNWRPGADCFMVSKLGKDLKISERVHTVTVGEVESQIEKLAAKLVSIGYIEI